MWFYFQAVTKESLSCPLAFLRKEHDAAAFYKNIALSITRLQQINEMPTIVLHLRESENSVDLEEILILNNGKFHKSCASEFSDLKLERAKRIILRLFVSMTLLLISMISMPVSINAGIKCFFVI